MAETSSNIAIKIGVDAKEVKTGTSKVVADFSEAYARIKKETAAVTEKMRDLAQRSRLGENIRKDAKDLASQQVALRNELAATITKYKELATVSQARTRLGLTPHADIAAEIAKAKKAYADLASSGKLSMRELAQAKVALREKVSDLREATNGWKTSLEKIKMEFVGIAATAAPAVLAIKEAVGFETAMVGVKKVVESTPAEFAALREQMLGLTREIPMTANELAKIATAGGQIGLAGKDIEAFTKLAAKMGFAFDMTAEEAGDAVGKIKNSYNMSIPEVEKFADTINRLGNTSATNEKAITDVILRIGGSASMFKLPTDGAAALAAGMLSLGMPAEVAGTAINAMLLKMQTAEKQGPKFNDALKQIGTSGEELADRIKTSPQAALDGLLDTLAQVEGTKRAGILVDLFGLEHGDEIARLVAGLETYKKAQAALMDQTKVAGGMEREFQEKMRSTEAQLKLMSNAWREVGINLGTVFLPKVKAIAGWLTSVLTTVADIVREFPNLSAGIFTLGSSFVVFGTLKKTLDIARLALISLAGKPLEVVKDIGGGLEKVSRISLGPWAQKVGAAFSAVSNGGLSLIAKVFGPIGKILMAWEAAQLFGNWLGQFDPVQKGMLSLIHSMDLVQLSAQKMWARITGSDADVAAVQQKIDAARQVYGEMLADINAGKGAGENPGGKKDEEKKADTTPPPTPEQKNEVAQKSADWYRTPDWVDSVDEAVLTPAELEAKKKRIAEREQQEKDLAEEKNKALDDVAEANAKEDARREKIRQADRERQADPNSVYYQPREQVVLRYREPDTEEEKPSNELADIDAGPAKSKKIRSKSSDAILSKKEITAQKEVAASVKAITDESEAYRLKALEEQTAAAKDAADKQAAAQKEGVEKMQSVFTAYVERVKTLQDEIAGREKSLADELAGLDPHSTEEQRWRRKAKAAADYEKAAKAAMAAGRLDEAREYADQAKSTYAGLKDGGGSISNKFAGRTAFSGVSSAGNLGLDISKMMTDAAATAAKSSFAGIDGLNSRVSGQLQKAVGSMAAAKPAGPGKQAPVQVHEIRLGKARLQGSADDVSAFIRQLELAGMRA